MRSSENSEILCTTRNSCAFGDSVLYGCEKTAACKNKKKEALRQRLEHVLKATCSVDYNECN